MATDLRCVLVDNWSKDHKRCWRLNNNNIQETFPCARFKISASARELKITGKCQDFLSNYMHNVRRFYHVSNRHDHQPRSHNIDAQGIRQASSHTQTQQSMNLNFSIYINH